MNNHLKQPLALTFFVFAGMWSYAQQNVGIGTLTPNPKALLELKSDSMGFLLPRMTTSQRIALAPSGAADIGLTVYDTDSSLFYFWNGSGWKYFPQKPGDDGWNVSGNNVYLSASGNVGIGVSNPSAKLHVFGTVRLDNVGPSTTNVLVLTVDASGNVKTRTLGNDLWDGDSVNDADADPDNECNTSIFYNTNTQELFIVDDCGIQSTVIPTDPNDADKDPTNEFQDLSSSTAGSNVTISISNGTGTTFSINDADANATNELQTLSMSKSGITVNWSLSNGGGSGSFNVDDNDWSGAGTGSMYPTTLTDKIGIGNAAPTYKLDVTGDIRASAKLYFSSASYYIQNSGTDLLLYSDNYMKFQTNKGHLVSFTESGTEAVLNFNLDGQDVMTLRGNGTTPYSVGIGTSAPVSKLQVAGDVRIGMLNPSGFTNGGNNYGDALYLSGGPASGGFDSDNDDPLFLARYNSGTDESELRIGIGDDATSSGSDRLSIGALSSGGALNTFSGLFDFEIENPGSSSGPMLSISPNGTSHVKTYHGGLAITKPVGSNGQYINLNRGSSTIWSIGYQYGTARFAIHEGNTNDAAFATSPYFTIVNTTGYVGLGVASPANRLELPNDNSSNGQGRAFAWIIYSDGRFKKNREDIGQVMPKVMKMQPLCYQWEKYEHDSSGRIQSTGELSDKKDIGFIAQDIYKLFPEVVMKPENEAINAWSMDYARLTVILTRAIQEQQVMLDAEKQAHQKTKSELENLRTDLEQLRQNVEKLQVLMDMGMNSDRASGKKPAD
ncbi:MAG TPA: tail fiber domain-containing protein [Chitinophagales bacterium]|nr:tail fiber domain-containing protein [Chitinophagales bacterium]